MPTVISQARAVPELRPRPQGEPDAEPVPSKPEPEGTGGSRTPGAPEGPTPRTACAGSDAGTLHAQSAATALGTNPRRSCGRGGALALLVGRVLAAPTSFSRVRRAVRCRAVVLPPGPGAGCTVPCLGFRPSSRWGLHCPLGLCHRPLWPVAFAGPTGPPSAGPSRPTCPLGPSRWSIDCDLWASAGLSGP